MSQALNTMATLIMRSIVLVFLFAQLKTSTSAFLNANTFPRNSLNKLITMVTTDNPNQVSRPSPHLAPEHRQSERHETKYLAPPRQESAREIDDCVIENSSNFNQENPCKGFNAMVTDPYGGNRKPPRHPPPKAAPERHQEELGISSSCRKVVTMVTDVFGSSRRSPPPPPMPSAPIHYGGNRKPPVYPPPKAAPERDQEVLGDLLPCMPGSSCSKTKTMVTDSRDVPVLLPNYEVMRGYRRIANFGSSTT